MQLELEDISTPEAPFPELLNHNHAPSHLEARVIRDALSEIFIKISRIDAELIRLQSAKEKLQRFKYQHEVIVSPLRRFPNEILFEIMEHCWTNQRLEEPAQAQRSAIALASVCSRWRAVALSTPQLWTTVICNHSNHCLPLTRLMLSRSGDCNLEWHVYAQDDGYTSPVIEALRPHLRRLGYFFSKNSNQTIDTLALRTSFQRLRTIRLTCGLSQYRIFRIFQNCPVLEDAEVEMRERDQTGACNMLELRRLHLSYYDDPSEFFGRITTPNLVELTSVSMGSENWPAKSVTSFLRRSKCSLRKLGLARTNSMPRRIWLLLDSVPHLEELVIDESSETDDGIFEYLAANRTLAELRTLTVRDNEDDFYVRGLHTMLTLRLDDFNCPLSNVVIEFRNETPGLQMLRSKFGSLIEDAKRLGYVLSFRDDNGLVLNVEH